MSLLRACPPAIARLPPEDIAQIKSSATITTLKDVAIGLVQNSLDAKAAKIELIVDFSRGNCTVEDNGAGISPEAFEDGGGISKAYWTSKYNKQDLHGRYGLFLSSIAALSLLVISSRQAPNRSSRSVSYHHAKKLSKNNYISAEHELATNGYGTRVSVRNLFGNMPVRVKQRPPSGDLTGSSQPWKELRHALVALILAWPNPTVLTIRSEPFNSSLILRSQGQNPTKQSASFAEGISTSQKLPITGSLSLLAQASLIKPESWASWVPIAASTSSVSVEGAISLEPAPSKHVQFICIGIRPVLDDSEHNELYAEINRLFAASAFGIVDEDADIDDTEIERRSKDRRFKTNGYSRKTLKWRRKGVDRWPMFFLRITLETQPTLGHSMGNGLEAGPSKLVNLLGILKAMVIEWLEKHGLNKFPMKTKLGHVQQNEDKTLSERPKSATSLLRPEPNQQPSHSRKRRRRSMTEHQGVTVPATIDVSSAQPPSQGRISSPFSTWSRTKASHRDLSAEGAFKSQDSSINSAYFPAKFSKSSDYAAPVTRSGITQNNGQTLSSNGIDHEIANFGAESSPIDTAFTIASHPDTDKYTFWQDPVTKQTFATNARSGASFPYRGDLISDSSFSITDSHVPGENTMAGYRTLRLESNNAKRPNGHTQTAWVESLLRKWNNPVFPQAEAPIKQISSESINPRIGEDGSRASCGTSTFLSGTSAFASTNISTRGLRAAEVLSQIDGKFILLKVPEERAASTCSQVASASRLVIVDQHAADERCKVEELFMELCRPRKADHVPIPTNLGYVSSINTVFLHKPIFIELPRKDCILLRDQGAYFARWGILYDVVGTSVDQSASIGQPSRVIVKALPPTISERCMARPKLLHELLRVEAWKRDGERAKTTSSYSRTDPEETVAYSEERHSWIKHIGDCPQGLINLINSRACRSAIMFNDELSAEQCTDLVSRLADCAFPFQCAHGRPSMVPLVDLGTTGASPAEGSGGSYCDGNNGFVQAFRDWQGQESTNAQHRHIQS